MKRIFIAISFFVFMCVVSVSFAESVNKDVYLEYPREKYLVGIGEANKTDNTLKDKRIAEVLARLEIAKQIKVRLREETIDIMCEGGAQRLFKDILQCKNEFIMIVEVTVDESLKGSNIVRFWEQNGIVYAAAVMPRNTAVKGIEKNRQESIDKTRDSIEKAKEGDKESIKEAQKEYMKAVTYDKEKELIDGVKSRASDVFEELEKEIVKLKDNR